MKVKIKVEREFDSPGFRININKELLCALDVSHIQRDCANVRCSNCVYRLDTFKKFMEGLNG